MIVSCEPFSPRLRITLHLIVASQFAGRRAARNLADRSAAAGLGYDWRNIMYLIAAVVSDDLYPMMNEQRPFDPGSYARRLSKLTGGWPPPQALGLQ